MKVIANSNGTDHGEVFTVNPCKNNNPPSYVEALPSEARRAITFNGEAAVLVNPGRSSYAYITAQEKWLYTTNNILALADPLILREKVAEPKPPKAPKEPKAPKAAKEPKAPKTAKTKQLTAEDAMVQDFAGRDSSETAKTEKFDSSVAAVAILCSMSYDQAHAVVGSLGRTPGKNYNLNNSFADNPGAVEGYTFHKVDTKFNTISEFLSAGPEGSWLVVVSGGKNLAVKNAKLHDTEFNPTLRISALYSVNEGTFVAEAAQA